MGYPLWSRSLLLLPLLALVQERVWEGTGLIVGVVVGGRRTIGRVGVFVVGVGVGVGVLLLLRRRRGWPLLE